MVDERVRDIFQHVQTRLARAAVDDLRARYDLAVAVRFVRDGKLGPVAIEDVAAHLGTHSSALHRQARIASIIRPTEFKTLLALRTPAGMPLTWSHVEKLALVPSKPHREQLARLAAEGGLGVRELVREASKVAQQ